jgi:RNA polymerase-associated protein LEO1
MEPFLRSTPADFDASKSRQLDDSDLDSGDDEGRADRIEAGEEEEVQEKSEISQPLTLPRHVIPEPSDKEV